MRRIWALGGLTLVLRAPAFFRPLMDLDEGSYASIACRMMQGGLPYRDGVENKFPGAFYLYYGVFELFGRNNMLAIHVVTALVAFATALTCGAIATQLVSRRAGWYAALFYTVYSTFYYPQMLAGNSEMFLVLPSALAVWIYLRAGRRWWLLAVAGVSAGVATLFKQLAAATLLALGADRLWSALRRRLALGIAVRDGLLLVLGFAATLAAVAVCFARLGVLDDAIFWSWTYVFRHYIPAAGRSAGFGLNFVIRFLPFAVTVSPLVLLAMRARDAELSPIWWWLIGMLGAAFVGGRMYGHYFLMVMPALSVLAGIGAERWLGEPVIVRRQRLLWGVTAVGAAGFLVAAVLYEGSTSTFWRPTPDYRQASAYIRKHTAPDERVFVWGWFPALYVEADRCPSTRFVYTHHLSGSGGTSHDVPEGWRMLLDDLSHEPPPYILDTSLGDYTGFAASPIDRYPQLARFVHDGYTVEAEIEGVRIYRRRADLGRSR